MLRSAAAIELATTHARAVGGGQADAPLARKPAKKVRASSTHRTSKLTISPQTANAVA
eukprot:CAMPEP_0181229346 /NCGR_PEP_ID=MMETSP1096-20121128/33844_1 /TAXON_ID=156174 ORGANISM="Chrysochromulina ericina, Strain CCMP281" /NCGR_SAMPLE_ID=MMETSP1096 /ASSEMBLY_ACC=CAM_ASM_000453 /LENGTH=57 /DNA_ID=CAMNT_0023322955 /DNA_START=377 /DNA_END=550 /DNA_ORIENTATION=-